MSTPRILLAALAALGLTAPVAVARDYPPPKNPTGATGKPKGPFKTRYVCEKNRGHGCFRTIQQAVDEAEPGDTVVVPDGTYREAVRVIGNGKRWIKLVGNTETPGKVVLEGNDKKQNGVFINGADNVTVKGFTAQNYKANGFFVVNAHGYTFKDLNAIKTGTYGLYAFNTTGGTMDSVEASWNNDSGLYIGQTPPQDKPVRSVVRNAYVWGNVIGFSGTNMKYVTITKSKFFNNGIGIVPNALDSEKYAPPEFNVITDNDVFWNNFDYFKGAPFTLRPGATGDLAYPVGTGILLFGSRDTKVTGNRIFGHYLAGLGMIEQLILKQPDAVDLKRNEFSGNVFGTNGLATTPGEDRNNVDIAYDGNGEGNCISGNTGVQVTVPADASTFLPCPFAGMNTLDENARGTMVGWAVADDREAAWVKRTPEHPAIKGITPLEHYTP